MEILETIPIYTSPDWPSFLVLGGIALMVSCAIFLFDTEWVGLVVFILAVIIVFTGIVTTIFSRDTIFSHNEYIVRISNMPVDKFIENYEITKRFKYSDVVQIKEIVKK